MYSIGIFAIEIFLLDFPLKGKKRLVKSVWDFSSVTWISAVSLTLQKLFQRCHWHLRNWDRWNITHNCYSHFCDAIDTTEFFLAASMTPLKFNKKCFGGWYHPSIHRHHCDFNGVIDTTEIVSAGSWTRHGNGFSSNIDTAEIRILLIFSAYLKPNAKRFSSVTQGPRGDCLMKKWRVKNLVTKSL
jgi:hypothetical protein